jgi:hypothetical protein
VKRACATEGDDGEVGRVVPTLYRYDPKSPFHRGIGYGENALCGRVQVGAERICDSLQRSFDRRSI